MKSYQKLLAASGLAFFTSIAQATLINFITLTENAAGLGESAWSSLNLNMGGVGVSITGHGTDDDNQQFAYLDWGNAGLGVCKDVNAVDINVSTPSSGANKCQPSSDDNVTATEYLTFMFDKDVTVNNLWFNNNHDGGFVSGDMVTIDGSAFAVSLGYAGGANGIGAFTVTANTAFNVAYNNQEFYVSGMDITANQIPEPPTLALLGLAIVGLTLRKITRSH